MRKLLLLLVFAFAPLMLADSCEAARPRWFNRGVESPRAYPSPQSRYQQAHAMYPKYNAGFHASYLQNMGVPTGDVGLRGNGITASAW
jgi:hypothetical protein